jgi:gluconate 2-dehydrogenase alpha chain
VGRHYFSHNQIGGVTALFPKRLNNWYGLPAQGVGVDEWADDNFDHSGLDFIGGGNLWVYSDRRPISAAGMSTYGKAPRWGSAWKAFIKQNADSWNVSYLQKTTLPYEVNYLDLDPREGSARLPGLPHHGRLPGQRAPVSTFIQDKMVEWYKAAGAIATEKTGMAPWGRRRTRTAGRGWATTRDQRR